MSWRKTVQFAILVFSTFMFLRSVLALNEPTHKIVNEQVANTETLHVYLQQNLRFSRGLDEIVQGKSVLAWIGEGGVREDDGARFLNHFHDPVVSWSNAGLSGSLSSIRWMQEMSQGWSWQKARDYYSTALSETNQSVREKAFADTFRALGQIMHLVVDASVPEHVRNDPHPFEGICRMIGIRCVGNYEYWVSDAHGRPGSIEESNFISNYLSNAVGFDSSILQQPTNDSAAPATVARLIDTDIYTGAGSGPNVTRNPAIGIGEIANANFFSEDTLYGSYPYPNVNALVPSQVVSPTTGTIFKYYAKGVGDGIPNDFAAAECILDQAARDEGSFTGPINFCVDEVVWSATAQLMLPRAVGYSRGVLDYFFRGKVDANPSAVEDFLWTQWDQRPNSIRVDGVSVGVQNGDEQAGQGTMRLVLMLRFTDSTENLPPIVVSHPVSVNASSSPQTVVFQFDSLPFPQTFPEVVGTHSAEYWASIVYRGPLGQESDAVVVGGNCVDPTDGSTYNWRYDFEHLHGFNPFEGGGGPDVHIAYIAWC